MHLRKLIAAAALGFCFSLGAAAQSDASAPPPQPDSGAAPAAKKSKKSSKKSTAKKSTSSKKKSRRKKGSQPAAAVQAPPAAAPSLPELPVSDDGQPPQLAHEQVASGVYGKPLAIAAKATDENGVYGPILYVRRQGLGADDYIPIRMVASKIVPGDYSVEIPAALTRADVLEYYIEAWDMAGNGPSRVASPEAPLAIRIEEEKKPVAPTTVMIKPKGAPPSITHSALAEATKNKPVEINARLVGETGVQNAAVMFRHKGEAEFKALPMGNIGGDDYTVTIPAAMVTSDLEYYLEAFDRYGNGPARSASPAVPYAMKVKEASAVMPTTPPPMSARRMLDDEPSPTYIGLGFDGGAPGGGGLTLLVRPFWWLRMNGGLAYNVAGFGWRGGLSFAPAQWAVTPTLNLDVGQYLSGDFNKFVTVTDSNATVQAAYRSLLANRSYNFATAQIGLEFGSQRRFVFYLRGGLTYLETKLNHTDLTAVAQNKLPNQSNSITFPADMKFSAIAPCASLGFNLFIY